MIIITLATILFVLTLILLTNTIKLGKKCTRTRM